MDEKRVKKKGGENKTQMRYLKRGSGGNRRGRSKRLHEEEDPLSSVANLFDVAMLFGLGLLVMVLVQMGMQEALTNPEKMKQIIERGKMLKMAPTDQTVTVTGDIVESGTLYEVKQPGGQSAYILVNASEEQKTGG